MDRVFQMVLALVTSARVGIATNFQPFGDPWNPDPRLYCTNRIMRESDVVVAHPKLPCGSRVWIYNLRNGRSVVATVEDRGPRHALVDLGVATAHRLRANGWERVLMIPEVIENRKESTNHVHSTRVARRDR